MSEESKGYPKGVPVAPGTVGEPEHVEKRVKAKLLQRAFVAGRYHDAGENVEVYEREKLAMVARGVAEGDRRKAQEELGASPGGFSRSARRGELPA